jgi:hypothetical protein
MLAGNTLSFWRDSFNLAGRRSVLETTCVEMKEHKAASITGRRHLNEITRAFRARSATAAATATSASTAAAAAAGAVADMEAGMAGVLKAYQEEVDQLARRAKFGEVCPLTRIMCTARDTLGIRSARRTSPLPNPFFAPPPPRRPSTCSTRSCWTHPIRPLLCRYGHCCRPVLHCVAPRVSVKRGRALN